MKLIYDYIIKTFVFLAVCIITSACEKDTLDANRISNAPTSPINVPDATIYPVVNQAHLIAYWDFNNNTKEQIGNRPATINKMVFSRDRNDYKSSCFNGDGKDNWFTIPADSKLKCSSVTVSVWVKPEALSGGTGFIVSLTQKGTWERGYCLFMDGSTSNYRFKATDCHTLGSSFGNNWFDKSGGYPEGQWFHLVYSWDESSNTQTIYVNGKEFSKNVVSDTGPKGPIVYSNGTTNAEVLYVAKNGGTDSWIGPYKGLMDDLRIYDVALSASEISQIYENEKPK